VSGPGGALWFAIGSPYGIGRITTSGTVTIITDVSLNGVYGITSGPDGALWFTKTSSSIGRLGIPKATDKCAGSQLCVAAVGIAASVSSPSESVVVTGKPDHPPGKVTLTFKKLKPGSLTCPKVTANKLPVASLSNKGYSKKAKLKMTVTLRQIASTGTARVCYHAPKPFKSQSPSTSKPGGGTGLLLTCATTKNVAPCVLSSKPVKTSIAVVLFIPGGDPDIVVSWDKQVKTSYGTGPGYGIVGKPFKSGFAISGMTRPVNWKMSEDSELPPGVEFKAGTGRFSGTPTAKGEYKVAVQAIHKATEGHKAEKSKIQSFTITISAPNA
jgi:hypothetical protein